ncbi:heme NO-binding domain-containing protein [Paenibacillus sp. IB182496]|uniref:Heme NO-binding domain-containing protein n=1 Tax=Paenibacillus sabuli TaxID=2772509 RepID=A0A927GT91_9BACL|nr:heme NO-binding domain-containing protein [Paenibacillus sabuli]MBD2847353.1 heme NO-binding domain-containing protein [Paenibacillus sabuli]
MKGVVFTSFIEMVEQKFSLEIADRVITGAQLPSGGSYTSVGTYDYREMLALVGQLSAATGLAEGALVRVFGEYLFRELVAMHPEFLQRNQGVFAFLEKVDSYIHVEVRKLYPDAELPRFESGYVDEATFYMEYRSSRPFADLAEGLIHGAIHYYGESIEVRREALDGEAPTAARFVLCRGRDARG